MSRALIALPLTLLLAGCTPLGTFLSEGPPQPEPGITAIPSATPSPEPTTGDCDDLVLNLPGEYHVGDCVRVTVEGKDVELKAGSIGTLVIRGDANDIDAGSVGSLDIQGNVNDVDTLDLGTVVLRGNYTDIGVHGSVSGIEVHGNDNEVVVDGDYGTVVDDGERNVVRQS